MPTGLPAQYQDRQILTLLARVASDLVERAGIDVQRHSVVADPLRIDLFCCRPIAYAGFLTDRHIDQIQIDARELFDLTDQSLQYGIAARALRLGKEQHPIIRVATSIFGCRLIWCG